MFLKICPTAEKSGGGKKRNLALEPSCFAFCLEEQEEFWILDAASTSCTTSSFFILLKKKKKLQLHFVLLCQMCSGLGNAEDTHFAFLNPDGFMLGEIAWDSCLD